MKKLYKKSRFIKFNARRSRRVINRRRNKKKNVYSKIRSQREKKNFIAPRIFSITKNPDETIEYFSNISKAVRTKHSVNLSLVQVEYISPEAILYMLVLVKEATIQGVRLSGSAPPVGTEAHKIFINSGFYKYVRSSIKNTGKYTDYTVLTVKTGSEVMPQDAKSILDFVKQRNIKLSQEDESTLYKIIIECMSNTNEHAADGKFGEIWWWAMAVYDSKENCIHFAMVDNGEGIAKTINKKLFEQLVPDADALRLAISGNAPRSRTGKFTRNQGLPDIKKYQDSGLIAKLALVANKGYYNVEENNDKKLRIPLKGSIITWDFKERDF